MEGIALKHRLVLERLEEMLGHRLELLHIVGGGTRDRLLSQLTANAVGRAVSSGPIEATAAGNLLMQLMALGHIGTLEEGRQVVCRSFEVRTYEPIDRSGWDEAFARMQELVSP